MGKQFLKLSSQHIAFIEDQKLYYVATAAAEGKINISPKGIDTIRVISPTEIVWLNLTGSGNETAAHIKENPRMTLMWCSFGEQPMILRTYGQAICYHEGDEGWKKYYSLFPDYIGARQIFYLPIELVQTSCGFGIPMYDYIGERDNLKEWAKKKGRSGIQEYWDNRNKTSLDGKPTGILPEKK